MHPTQKAILDLLGEKTFLSLNLAQIGRDIEENHPQTVKYHLQQLKKKGFISIDFANRKVTRSNGTGSNNTLASLPIYGTANCGSAVSMAHDSIEGFLPISKTFLKGLGRKLESLIVLRASGNSMNEALIGEQKIEDGDFVVVDTERQAPKNGDCVVSIIDGCANIKRFYQDDERIALIPDSSEEQFPIYIHKGDDYHIAGEVVRVIKKPQLAL